MHQQRTSSHRRKGTDFQFVWPRDRRPNGSKKRTKLQAFSDILCGKGPDIFVTRKHDKTPIPSDMWGNWAGYHSPEEQAMESRFSAKGIWGIGNADRRYKRYDPSSRKYVEWDLDQNWDMDLPLLPRYTRKEHELLARHPQRRLKGKDYGRGRPNRTGPEHQDFWYCARRIADNRIAGYMEEADNIKADRLRNALVDNARGTPGMTRRHTIGQASRGMPDYFEGGPGERRQWSPIYADYPMGRDNRGLGLRNDSWLGDEEFALGAIYGGENDYWDPRRYY